MALRILFPLLTLFFASSAYAGTCALCKEALESGGSAGFIEGFYWSTILIVGMPFIIMSGIGFAIWRIRRQLQTSH